MTPPPLPTDGLRAIANLRHLYANMMLGDDKVQSMATGLLGPAIEALEAAEAARAPLLARLARIAYPDADLSNGLSTDGMLICGDAKSIGKVHQALHAQTAVVPALREELMETRAALAANKENT